MSKIKVLGSMDLNGKFDIRNRVYSAEGLCPTIDSMTGGGREPMILDIEKVGVDLSSEQAQLVEGCTNAIPARYDRGITKHKNEYTGILEVERLGNVGEIKTQGRAGFDSNGLAPTLISGMSHGNTVPYITEEKAIKINQATEQGFALCEIGGAVDLGYPTSKTRRGRVIENGKICPTLTTENIPNKIELGNPKFFNFLYEIEGELWFIRIRKLTPKECWRLMGFYDEDFEKAAKVCSNTQLYKQAGNSIVVDVLEAIFGQLLKGEEDELHNSG